MRECAGPGGCGGHRGARGGGAAQCAYAAPMPCVPSLLCATCRAVLSHVLCRVLCVPRGRGCCHGASPAPSHLRRACARPPRHGCPLRRALPAPQAPHPGPDPSPRATHTALICTTHGIVISWGRGTSRGLQHWGTWGGGGVHSCACVRMSRVVHTAVILQLQLRSPQGAGRVTHAVAICPPAAAPCRATARRACDATCPARVLRRRRTHDGSGH